MMYSMRLIMNVELWYLNNGVEKNTYGTLNYVEDEGVHVVSLDRTSGRFLKFTALTQVVVDLDWTYMIVLEDYDVYFKAWRSFLAKMKLGFDGRSVV